MQTAYVNLTVVILRVATWVSLISRFITTQVSTNLCHACPTALGQVPINSCSWRWSPTDRPLPPRHSSAPSLVKARSTDWPWWSVLTHHPPCPHRNLLVLNAEPSFHQPPKGTALSSPNVGPQKHPYTDAYRAAGQTKLPAGAEPCQLWHTPAAPHACTEDLSPACVCGESDGQYKMGAPEGSVVSSAAQLSAEASSLVSEEKLARHPLMYMCSILAGGMEAASRRELTINCQFVAQLQPRPASHAWDGKGAPLGTCPGQ